MARSTRLTCKDCPPGTKRPAPYQGPRCATHHRARRTTTRRAAHDRRLRQVYGIDREFFEALLAEQDGTCAICQRARGIRKQLSVDHDHAQAVLDGHPEEQGCPKCVRGLLCSPCNKMLGHLRDDPTAFQRAATYLTSWPSRAVTASAEASEPTTTSTPTATSTSCASPAGAEEK